MALKIHDITIDADGFSNAVSTLTTTVTVNIYATGAPVDIAYSNDGVTFSAYQAFRISLHGFDITTLGGDAVNGRHTVYVKIRDASLNELTGSSEYILGQVPIAEVTAITTTTVGANIKYSLLDCGSSINDLCLVEYSTTGAFGGEEGNATMISSASAHTGTVGLQADKNGYDQTFVWDYKFNLTEDIHNIWIRTQIKNEFRTGSQYIFGPFIVNNKDLPDPGFKLDEGDSKTLKVHYVGSDGKSFDPDQVQITEILDPALNDVLGGPLTLVPIVTGNYQHNYVSSAGDPVGIYAYTFVATVGTVQKAETLTFELVEQIASDPVCPSTPDGTVVSGQLEDVTGMPLVGTQVYFFPSDIADLEKVDSISGDPITVETDDCGKFTAELVKNKAYVVIIPDLQYRKVIRAPSASGAEFASIPTIQLPVGPRDPYGNPTGGIFDDLTELIPGGKC
jgi:hypothetical protein